MTETNVDFLDGRTPVGAIVIEAEATAAVFEARKIDYYCAGDLPLGEACRSTGVPLESILAELSDVTRRANASRTNWREESLGTLTDHILSTHHVFTRDEVMSLPELSERVRDRHASAMSELDEVDRLVGDLSRDLMQHMMKEEQILFPWVTELERSLAAGEEPPIPVFGTIRNPVHVMILEHDAAGDLLRELRRLTTDYAVPMGGAPDFGELMGRLEKLEEDLHFHIHLENNLYFPRAIEMEAKARR